MKRFMEMCTRYHRRVVDMFTKRQTAAGGGRLVAVGVVVHLILLYAVFDVYYKSPIIRVDTRYSPTRGVAPAKRLVLFVADGLRAQSFFHQEGRKRAPFLWELMSEGRASFGVSESHVPTESRPGHVALTAGLYEDVSAVTRGWGENPVDFDSIFNQSRFTWSWGSPDILPMFAKGATGNHIFMDMYDSEDEDFGDAASHLDTWVFGKVKEFLKSAKRNATLAAALRADRVVLFLHLLGTDTIGHGQRPHSIAYNDNIRIVDSGVAKTAARLAKFFGHDNQTAFVFTADHGMTDWGAHGAGTPHETLTPLVVWGAGVATDDDKAGARRARGSMTPGQTATATRTYDDEIVTPATGLPRRDVEQIALAPLMASLIGVPIPSNSIGLLPISYLKVSAKYRFLAAHANYRQVLAQYQAMKLIKKSQSWRFMFHDFPGYTEKMISSIEAEITRLSSQARWDVAADLCLKYVPALVEGVFYYHRYERVYLSAAVLASFVGWLCVLAASLTRQHDATLTLRPTNGCLLVCGVVCALLHLQNLPLHRHVYFLLPVYLANLALPSALMMARRAACEGVERKVLLRWIAVGGACLLGGLLSTCLLSAVFFYRWLLSLCLLLVSLWPVVLGVRKAHQRLAVAWTALCIVNGAFVLLPTIGKDVYPLFNLFVAAVSTVVFGRVLVWPNVRLRGSGVTLRSIQDVTRLCQVVTLALCTFIIYVRSVLELADGVVAGMCQFWSWLILLGCFVTPMMAWAIALYCPYVLMSLSHESVFFVAFCGLLLVWLRLETVQQDVTGSSCSDATHTRPPVCAVPDTSQMHQLKSRYAGDPRRPLTATDVRRVYFCIVFLLLAIFGTGNIASLNSFSPSFIRCFVTVFRPFLMALLLVTKVLMPIVVLFVAYHFVLRGAERSVADHLPVMMIVFDSMAMVFFVQLKDTGSWLDIGVSISHYLLSMIIPVAASLLLQLAAFLASNTILDQ